VKLLFFTKRRPQNRDLFTRPYGRFYHIPRLLAQAGAEVHLVLCSYEPEPQFIMDKDGMTIYSRRMSPNLPMFSRWARQLSRNIQPDVVVGLSDTWFGIVAASTAAAGRAKLVIDAYDNYEAYLPHVKPLHWLWHRALAKADGLTAAGPQLLELLRESNSEAHHRVVPMAADPMFQPKKCDESRHALKLPLKRKLIGYLGTADSTRGFDLFLQALNLLGKQRDDFDLVLSGRSKVETHFPGNRLHQLGYVADELMPDLLNSCDLLVCVNKDSAFGNYSYPVKIYEALACGRPVLASDTAPARWILGDDDRILARVGDAGDLAEKMSALLDAPEASKRQPGGWESSARLFSALLKEL
jgi:glycosyltransferase involved in cell wall biosynthesis